MRRYRKKYTLLLRLMGFVDKPTMGYKVKLNYEFLKLRYFNPDADNLYISDCVPRVFFKHYLSHYTNHYRYGHNCINKALFYQLMHSNGIPIPKPYFLISNSQFTDIDGKIISPQLEDNHMLFTKPLGGSVGKGAKVLAYKDVVPEHYDDFIFQEVCANHDSIKKLAPNKAFNTIRVHTYLSEKHDKLEILAAHIKLAAQNSIFDNIGTGGVGVPINISTGELFEFGFSEFTHKKIDKYPGSETLFKGFKIPYWEQLIEYVEKASRIVKTNLVGWDIGITNEGVVFIEGNSGSDIFILQVFYQPFYNSLLIKDQLAVAKYHKWIVKYESKYKRMEEKQLKR